MSFNCPNCNAELLVVRPPAAAPVHAFNAAQEYHPQNGQPAPEWRATAPANAPWHHGKEMRHSNRGYYCATRLDDGTWCKYRPNASQPAQDAPYAPQGQGVASGPTRELP